nr:pre-mRNA cleavage factor Im 25 kDa subunit 2-like [Cryptomonas curvata]
MKFVVLKKKKLFLLIRIYNISNYSFKNKKKNIFINKKNITLNIYKNLKNFFELKTYIGIIMLVYVHNFPHILLIRSKKKKKVFCLPGGYLFENIENNNFFYKILEKKFDVKSVNFKNFLNIGKWFFPDFEKRIKYPYLPSHKTSVKTVLYLYLLELETQNKFEVNTNWDLIAVPLFELNDNVKKYGIIIAKLSTNLFSILSDKNKTVI